MLPVKMYSTATCAYCLRAKALLKQRGVEQIDEIRVDIEPAERENMPFASIELLAVGAALFVYARHAGDRERVVLQPGRLTVECTLGSRTDHVEFAPAWSIGPGRGHTILLRPHVRGQTWV